MFFKITSVIPGLLTAVIFIFLLIGCIRIKNGVNLKRCLNIKCISKITAFCVILSLVFGFSNYISEKDARWFNLNLNFENASKGLNQNGTRFNYTSLITRDMLEDVIENGGYDITADELYDLVWTSTAYDEKEPDTENPIIATQYTVHLSGDIAEYDIDPDKLIEDIKEECINDYLSTTTENTRVLSVDFDAYDNIDYLDAADRLELDAKKIKNYMSSYRWDEATFRDEDNETFASLSQKISDFIDVEINSYRSFLKEKGIAKDKEKYITTLTYKNKTLSTDKKKQDAIYDSRLEGIKIYDGDMARVVLVPTKDSEDEFYMSRTKIGVDYFSDEANEALSKSSDLSQQISDNKDILKRLKSSTETEDDDYKKAEQMLETMEENLDKLSKSAVSFFNSYIKDDQKGYIKIELGEQRSIKDIANINKVIKFDIIFAIALILIYATKKENKDVSKKTC